MAKVEVRDSFIDIRVNLFERLMLAERSRRVPLERVRGLDAHPPLMQLVLHWADQSSVWMSGASTYEGHLVPSTRNPGRTLAIDLDEDDGRIFVEVDDEPCESVVQRIEHALESEGHRVSSMPPARLGASPSEVPVGDSIPPIVISRKSDIEELMMALTGGGEREPNVDVSGSEAAFADPEDDHDDVRRRDPLLQGSFAPPAHDTELAIERVATVDVEGLARAGFWMIGLGTLAVITGMASVSAGRAFGLLVLGAGLTACVIGGLALRHGASRAD